MQNSNIYTTEWMNGFATAMRYMGADIPAPYAAPYYFDDRDSLLNAIEDTIREDLGFSPECIYSRSRKQQTVFLRSCAWSIYQEISGSTQQQTAAAFGQSHNRSTYVNMKRSALALKDAYPEYRKQFQIMKSGVMIRYIKSNAALQADYIDLGLPSGTLWSAANIGGTHHTDTAHALVGDAIPTTSQAQELLDLCTISYNHARLAFHVDGPNGKTIVIPADGYEKNGVKNLRTTCAALLLRPDEGTLLPEGTITYLFLRHEGKIYKQVKIVQDSTLELSVRKVKSKE